MNKYSIRGGQKLTNPNRKKALSMISISLFMVALISLGTYAIWTSELFTGNSSISSGQVKMSYTETNEIGMTNALPIKDEEGKVSTNYFDFQVLSYVKTRANDSIQRKINYKVILEPITVDNPLSDSEIKVYLTKVENGNETVVVEPTTIDQLSNYVLNSQDEVFSNNKGEVVTSYRLRAWIDEKVDTNKLNEKKYSYKFRVNINSGDVTSEKPSLDKSGANAPALTSNMIPVYYDSTSNVWKKADGNNADESNRWYDYDNKMWANAVTVTSTNRDTYLKASAGTTIPMSDINTMWVWIPRYTYTYLNTNTPEEIKIKFESGINSSGTIKCVDAINQTDSDGNTISETCEDTTNNGLVAGTSTYTHPAFWWDKNDDSIRTEDEELTGIWVGKFEVSSDTTCTVTEGVAVGSGCNLQTIRPRILPDVQSWRGAQLGTFFNGIYNMRESGNQYGFKTTDETHMMKNMEWGAVAYLSHSKYGINKEININNSSDMYTGRSGGSVGGSTAINTVYTDQTSTTQYNKYGFYTYDGYLLSYDTNAKSSTRNMSKIASSTGNIYGIYDLSGGSVEFMMGNTTYSDGQQMSGHSTTMNENSAFTGILYDSGNGTSFTGTYAFPSKRYYDKYSNGAGETFLKGKLGDATKEMAPTGYRGNWYSDLASLPGGFYPWFSRGELYNGSSGAGGFTFTLNSGWANTLVSTRAVISNLN